MLKLKTPKVAYCEAYQSKKCKLCGKTIPKTYKTDLCGSCTYFEGVVFILNMKEWKWKREIREIKC